MKFNLNAPSKRIFQVAWANRLLLFLQAQ